MIPTRTAAAHMDLAQHRCPLMSLVHPRASGADPPKWLGADQKHHRLLLPLSTCLTLPTGAWPAKFLRRPPASDAVVSAQECDHSDCSSQDVRFPADLLCKRCLIARTDRNLCMRHIAARRTIDQVYSKFLELTGEFDRLLNIPAAIRPIGGRNAYK